MSGPDPQDGGDDGEAGFALAEVLVAFAILALVTLATMRAFGGSAAALSAVARSDARLDLAERVLERARAAGRLAPGRDAGEEAGLRWWRLAEPVAGAGLAPPPGARQLLRLSVGVGAKGEPTAAAPLLETLVLARAPGE